MVGSAENKDTIEKGHSMKTEASNSGGAEKCKDGNNEPQTWAWLNGGGGPMKLLKCAVGRWLTLWLTLAVIGGTGNSVSAQEDTFYYKKDQKIPLKVDFSKTFVLFSPDTTRE